MIEGAAGEAQFSDACVNDPTVIALRRRVAAEVDNTMDEDAAVVSITLRDGTTVTKHVTHCIGGLAHPMSDSDLEAKFRALCDPIIASEQIDRLIEACWQLDRPNRLDDIASVTVPRSSVQSFYAGAAVPRAEPQRGERRGS